MATFGELVTDISGRLSDGSLQDPTTSQIQAVINQKITYLRNKPFWFMYGTDTLSLVSGNPLIINLPSDFRSEVPEYGFVIDYNNLKYPLRKINPLEYEVRDIGGQGLPYCYTYMNNQYLVYFLPDQNYDMIVNYRITLADLVNDSDTNVMTVNAASLIVYESLAEIYSTYRRDKEQYTLYKTLAKDEYNEIIDESYRRMGTGKLTAEYKDYLFHNFN